MRISARPLATLLLGVGVATCSDTPIAAVKQGPGPNSRGGFARVALAASFSKSANFAAANADLFGITYDSVHIQLRGTPDTTLIVKDTVIHFSRASADTSIDLLVPVQADGQKFDASMAYESASGQVFFSGHVVVQSYPPSGSPPPNQAQITINYVGPGSRVAHIVVAPKTVSLLATQTTSFTVSALDSAGASTPPPPVNWSSSNTNVGTVSSSGLFTPTGLRGTTTVTATTPTGLTDNASVNVTLPASRIILVSGGGQTGKVGSTLANPAVVQVAASDGVGVAGVGVVFSAPAGGSVSPTSATTDATGHASTTLRLGSAAGPQGFAASSAGFSVGINETATAGDPAAIAAVSGGGQSDTVGHALHSPLVVHVSDQSGNPVSGATVSWTRTGSGSLSAATSTTGADGNASVNYTLGTTVGSETISASVSGVNGSVSFTETAVAAAPTNIVAVSGGAQSGTVNRTLAAPFVVRVTDDAGNPSAGATVTWSATSGTINPTTTTTDASGQTSATLTLPRTVGSIGVSASIANGHSANFSASANPGIIAALTWRVQPSNARAGATIAPAMQIAAVDSFGNSSPSTLPITLTLHGGSGATLGGTVTKSPSGGVATFDDITVNRAANGYTLVASMTTPAISSPSAAFNVTASSAATFAVSAGDNQSATVNTAVATPPAVVVKDSLGNPIAGLSVTFAPASGSGSVAPSGGTVTTDVLGVAALTSWTLGQTAGAQSLVASAAGLGSITFHATAQAGAAAALKVTTQPSASATSGQALAQQPVVQVVDAFGNAVPAGTMQVTASASSGTLSGTNPVTANSSTGVASFTDLKITGSGNVTLTFAAPNMQSATSNAIAVSSSGPSQLVLVPSTSNGFTFTAGSPPALPVVKAADAAGAGVAGVPIHVAVTVGSVTAAVKDTVTGADGTVGAPANVIPTKAATYTITLTSSAIPNASASFTFTVTAGAAAKVAFTTQPSNVVAGVSISPAVVVQVQDAFGNVVSGATNSVTLTSNPSVTLGGTATVAAVSGNATFASVSVPTAGTYTLSASAGSLTAATSSSFTVSSASPDRINLSNASGLSIVAGNVLSSPPTATVLDAAGSPIVGASVTLSVKQGSTSIGSRAVATDALGQVSFGALTLVDLPTAVGTYTITATSGSITSSAVNLTVNAASASKIKLSASNSAPPAGAEVSIVAFVTDAFGNTASDAGSRTISWSTSAGSFDGTPTNMSNGIASAFFISASGTSRVTATDQSGTPLQSGSIDITATTGGLQLATSGSAPASSATVGNSVGAPAVLATSGGTPVSGIIVKFTPTGGGKVFLSSGSPADAISKQSDNSGVTSIFAWTVGTTAGTNNNGLAITAAGSSNSINYTASAIAGTATQLAFGVQPSNVNSGVAVSPAIKVQVRDAFGNEVTTSNAPIALAIHGSTSAVLSGGASVAAVNGEATFSSVSVDLSGTYQLDATSSGLTTATSNQFTVSVGTVASLVFVSGHSAGSSVADDDLFSPTLQVKALDAGGNPVSGVTIDASVASPGTGFSAFPQPPGPAAFDNYGRTLPTLSLTSASTSTPNGIADFGSGKMRGTVQSFRITFTARGTSVTLTTGNITLNHGVAKNAACTASLPSRVGLSHKLSVAPAFAVTDVDLNAVSNTSVTLTPSSGSTLDASSTVTTDASGNVTGPHWTVGSTAGAHTVGVSGASGTCAVNASAISHIKLTGSINSSKRNGDAIESIDATVVDASDNAIEDTTFTITVGANPQSGRSGTVDGTSTHSSDSHGKATFADLKVNADDQTGMTLAFGVSGLPSVTATSTAINVSTGTAESLTATTSQSVSAHTGQTDAALSSTPTVRIKDHGDHNLVSNQAVSWSIVGSGCPTTNGPTFTAGATSTTDNTGTATIPALDLGFSVISSNCSIRAAVGSLFVDFALTLSPGF